MQRLKDNTDRNAGELPRSDNRTILRCVSHDMANQLLEMQKECCFEEEPVIEEWSEQASANFEPEKIDAPDGRKDDVTIALDGVGAEPEDDSIAITDRSS